MNKSTSLYLVTGALGAALFVSAALLWVRYGNLLFSDKLLNALAGCFGL